MTKQEAIKWLFQYANWKKKDWVEKLDVSYAQLRKWLSDDEVNISALTVVKAAGLHHFGIEWLDTVQRDLNLYPIREELTFSEKIPFTEEMIPKKLRNIEEPIRTEIIPPSPKLTGGHQFPKLHTMQIKQSERQPTKVGLDISSDKLISENAISATIMDTAMIPLLKPGMVVYAEPQEDFINGELVLVKIPENGVLIGEYFEANDIALLVRINAPPLPFNFDQDSTYGITWINLPESQILL
ncbi:MAG: S24 family peptidase [Candidatus Marinimicrobia bacterium]|nr:S24 family peptidase [Candidatus Neomarinimicrobiota bacterium]